MSVGPSDMGDDHVSSTRYVLCSDCNQLLGEVECVESGPSPCPYCGSLRRTIHLVIEDLIKIRETEEGKVRDPMRSGKKRIRIESLTESGVHQKTGRPYMKERLIDRGNDIYKEEVIDPTTGEVIHRCEEPLSKHRGHGSAKGNTNDELRKGNDQAPS